MSNWFQDAINYVTRGGAPQYDAGTQTMSYNTLTESVTYDAVDATTGEDVLVGAGQGTAGAAAKAITTQKILLWGLLGAAALYWFSIRKRKK